MMTNFVGCSEHAERGRASFFLWRPWSISYRNCTLHCCKLLCFWPVRSFLLHVQFLYDIQNGLTFRYLSRLLLYPNHHFCYWRMKKSVPEKYKSRPETSLATALLSATFATLMCYPLDTVRRQMQMKGTPYNTIFDAIPGSWLNLATLAYASQ